MIFKCPGNVEIPQLLQLWKEVFGEYDGFWELFRNIAFLPDHCRCITENGQVIAGLYWFDCRCGKDKIAYIYAVVTDPAHRGRGLCRALMESTHDLLRCRGYAGAVLVPQQEGLRAMYAGMGYRNCGGLQEITCAAGEDPIAVQAIGPAEFAALRRTLLPPHSVLQEGHSLDFLARQLQFYRGSGFLLAAFAENGILQGMELLGDPSAAPAITAALGCREGRFRIPGDRPFAMFHPLAEGCNAPDYFGFAFD